MLYFVIDMEKMLKQTICVNIFNKETKSASSNRLES